MTPQKTTLYQERLWASVWFFLATALVIPASLVVFLPINPTVGVIVAIVLYGACVALLIHASAKIEVTTEQLTAGRATLPIRFVGATGTFREPDATAQRGPQLDARAWPMIRGWVSPVVRIDLTDEQDPTPYWLLSTRHPEKLVDALTAAKTAATDKSS